MLSHRTLSHRTLPRHAPGALAQSLASLGQNPRVLLASEGLSHSADSLTAWMDTYEMRSALSGRSPEA